MELPTAEMERMSRRNSAVHLYLQEHSVASALAGDLPRSLPAYLVFHCGNPEYWVYADQRCNGMNDCGDCSDEMGRCKSAFGLHLVKDLLIG